MQMGDEPRAMDVREHQGAACDAFGIAEVEGGHHRVGSGELELEVFGF